ncbi:MAG: M12 family metallo-peptidase [Candidatus Thiodiazotropha sp.]
MYKNNSCARIFGVAAFLFSLSLRAEMFEYLPEVTIKTNSQMAVVRNIQKTKGTESVKLVRINLDSLKDNGAVEVNLQQHKNDMINDVHIEMLNDSEYTWIGTLSGIPGGAVLIVSNGMVTGTLRSNEGLYRIQPIDNKIHALIKVDEKIIHDDDCESETSLIASPGHIKGIIDNDGIIEGRNYSIFSNVVSNIDVLVLVTRNAEISYGDNIYKLVQLAVAETNTGFDNSNIDIRLKLAGMRPVSSSFDESNMSLSQILYYMLVDFDYYLNDIDELRKQYSADIVVLVVGEGESCGRAAAINARASNAFAVVRYNCMTGNYTFGHEIGHLLGARHNPEEDPSTRPYPQGHGFRYDPFWRTIMSYNCPQGCPRILYWSNPDVYNDDVATGTYSRHNNTSVLNMNAGRVSRFSDSL